MAVRKNILKLARKISGPVAMLITLDENAPEYKVLNCVVTDEMAEVALAMELRGPMPLEKIAKRCGKPLEETKRLVDQLAEAGVCIFHSENGVDVFELPVFVPGVMEKMMNNRAQCEKHPEIPAGFEEYARLRGGLLSPKLPVGASPMRVIPIQSAIDGGHRMLVFSQFTSMLEILENELDKEGIEYYVITGSTLKEERVRLVKEFNSGTVPVFFISLKAGGVGLNLTGADVVIHYDPWWNQAVQDQATDRAHRIGQTKKVTVYKLIAKSTIEEKIQKLQETKRDLADQIIGGGSGQLSGMSREDILALLEQE